ncbi:unnamed protein product [Brachionus calyciflorus]|uniref:Uncharacterized protein n=1 Tax=Brachionus calyciflorus TaxID=104777 RepID=A0A813TJ71_9BILA|nr:unnamed protein product [Brachionus calyciflorus]
MSQGKTSKRPASSPAESPTNVSSNNLNKIFLIPVNDDKNCECNSECNPVCSDRNGYKERKVDPEITIDEIQSLTKKKERKIVVKKSTKKGGKTVGVFRRCPTIGCNGEGSLDIKRKSHRSLKNCPNKVNLIIHKSKKKHQVDIINKKTLSQSFNDKITKPSEPITSILNLNMQFKNFIKENLFFEIKNLSTQKHLYSNNRFLEYLITFFYQKRSENTQIQDVIAQNTKRIDTLLSQNAYLKKEIEVSNNRIEEFKQLINEKDKDKKDLEDILKNLQNFIETCRNLSNKYLSKEEKSRSKSLTDEIDNFFAILQENSSLKEQNSTLEINIQLLKEELEKKKLHNENNEMIQILSSKVTDLNASFKEIYEEFDSKEDELEETKQQMKILKKENEYLNEKMKNLDKQLLPENEISDKNFVNFENKIVGLKEKCKNLTQRLENKDLIIQSLENQNTISSRTLIDNQRLINELQVKYESASEHKIIEMRMNNNNQVELLSSEIAKKVSEISQLVEEREKLEIENIELKKSLEIEKIESVRLSNSIEFFENLKNDYKKKYEKLINSNCLNSELEKLRAESTLNAELRANLQAELNVKNQENQKFQVEIMGLKNQVNYIDLKNQELTKNLNNSQNILIQRQDEIVDLGKNLDEKNSNIDKLTNEILDLNKFKSNFQKDVKSSDELVNCLNSELEKLRAESTLNAELRANLQAELNVKNQENQKFQVEIMGLENQVNFFDTKNQELTKNLKISQSNNINLLVESTKKIDVLVKNSNFLQQKVKDLNASIDLTENLNETLKKKDVDNENLLSDLYNELDFLDGETEQTVVNSKSRKRTCPTFGCDGNGSIHKARSRHFTLGSCPNRINTPPKKPNFDVVVANELKDQIYDLEQKLLEETNKNTVGFSKSNQFSNDGLFYAVENENLRNELAEKKSEVVSLKLEIDKINLFVSDISQQNKFYQEKLRCYEEIISKNETLLNHLQQKVNSLNPDLVNMELVSKDNEIQNLILINRKITEETYELRRKLEKFSADMMNMKLLNEKNDTLIQTKNLRIRELEEYLKSTEALSNEEYSKNNLFGENHLKNQKSYFFEDPETERHFDFKPQPKSLRTSPYPSKNLFSTRSVKNRISDLKSRLHEQKVQNELNELFVGNLRSSGCANGNPCYLGPEDGIYYYNSNGNKSWLSLEQKLKDLKYDF